MVIVVGIDVILNSSKNFKVLDLKFLHSLSSHVSVHICAVNEDIVIINWPQYNRKRTSQAYISCPLVESHQARVQICQTRIHTTVDGECLSLYD